MAQMPPPTALPGKPFFIRKTWVIGGIGPWDYLTLDPKTLQLFVAHGTVVQVVDVNTGTVMGEVSGLRAAHGIALDDTGQFGYVSDGPASEVKVFDRGTLKVVAAIPTGPSPRAVVFEPQTKLVFAVSADPIPEKPSVPEKPRAPERPGAAPPANVNRPRSARNGAPQEYKSTITVIDAQTQKALGTVVLPGKLSFAQASGEGQVYVSIVDRNEIAWIDATEIEARMHGAPSRAETALAEAGQPVPARQPGAGVTLDWSAIPHSTQSSGNRVRFFPLGPGCREPRALAVDSRHVRLFAACDNMKMEVLNGSTGELVTSLPIGPGVDAVGYDAEHGLIYTANGDAQGSLTIIRQDVTDSYNVIQILPTRDRARTLAVNPSSGEVYLVTDLTGVKLGQPGGIGTLKTAPIDGSFQVLVIGN